MSETQGVTILSRRFPAKRAFVTGAASAGLVLNVASAAGFAAGPQTSAYNATKAPVISLSETLAAELQGSGVQAGAAAEAPVPGLVRQACRAAARAAAGACESTARMKRV
jgi:hypothetical protein